MDSRKWMFAMAATAALLAAGCADDSPAPVKEFCGDTKCNNGETIDSCPQDCRTTPLPECGDGICEPGEESTCPEDCIGEGIICGNGKCEVNETFDNCPSDCSYSCGDGLCNGPETLDTCPQDCDVCSDKICGLSENALTCPEDCKVDACGDGTCDAAAGETYITCSKDCPKPVETDECGDGVCSDAEAAAGSCNDDCPYDDPCGDGVCDPQKDETAASCPQDCGPVSCGDGVCVLGETSVSCPADCRVLSSDEYDALANNERRYRIFHDLDIAYPTDDTAITFGSKKLSNEDFFRHPYPSELRTDEYGRASILGWQIPGSAASFPFVNDMYKYLQTERPGFSPIGAIYFRATHDLSANALPSPDETRQPNSCYKLINVEKKSTHYGELVPVHVTFHPESNVLWAANTLVMRPVPGLHMHPGDRHVAIVENCLQAEGRAIEQSVRLSQIFKKTAPTAITDRTNYYVDALNDLGYDLSKIVAFTGFDTMDVVSEMMTIANHLKGKATVTKNADGTAKGEYEQSASYGYFFRGEFETINYMAGEAPYGDLGSGQIAFDPNGKLVNSAKREKVRFGISIPSSTMPANGYPIIVYGHGTGGDYSSHCSIMRPGYTSEGNWLLYKEVHVAMIGFDAVLHGDRGPFESDLDLYVNFFKNPIAIRESWRQTVVDMLVLYDLLERGEIVLPSPVAGGQNVTFDPSYGLYMGHSQGSQEGGLLLGLTNQIKSAFLSAGGGGIIQSFMDLVVEFNLTEGMHLGPLTVADLVGTLLLGVREGELTIDTFVANQFIQPLLDPIEPLNFTHRFIKEPPAGWQSKNIVQTIGLRDQSTPNEAQFAMITGIGLPTVGNIFVKSEHMQLAGLADPEPSPASNNVKSADGTQTVTGGALQFDYTGSSNPHFVIYRMKDARDTYPAFFQSVLNGTPTVTVVGTQQGDNFYD